MEMFFPEAAMKEKLKMGTNVVTFSLPKTEIK